MKIMVHKCPWTGTLFEDPKKYRKHLKVLRKAQVLERERKRVAATFDEWIAPLYELGTTDEIAEWLSKNFYKVVLHSGEGKDRYGRKIKHREATAFKFTINSCKVDATYSTTHNAPKGQRKSGWGKEPLVTEAAWKGRIRIEFEGDGYRLFDSNYLRDIGVNTGSGGGGEDKLEYELVLFLKDFHRLRYLAQKSFLALRAGYPALDSNGNEYDKHKTSYSLFDCW